MDTLQQIERSILNLSRIELERLTEWLRELAQGPFRVAEPPARKAVEFGDRMTFEEYLDYEAGSRIRHEYLAGDLFAMSGVSRRHNRIAGRLCRAFEDHLKGGPCEVYTSDVMVKLRVSRDDYVYYPDVMVVCDRGRPEERFVTDPKLIVEVLSPSTEYVDRGEKRYNYRRIAALEEYVVVAQAAPQVTVYRRAEGWKPAVLDSREATLELRSIGLSLPLGRVYEDGGERSA